MRSSYKPSLSCKFFQVLPVLKITCAIGYHFDYDNNNCKLVWNIAGTWNKTEELIVLCPDELVFNNITNTCIKPIGRVAVIAVPIVCNPGFDKDGNGKCREVF